MVSSSRHAHPGHALTGFGTAAADLGTLLHHLIITKARTVVGTALTKLGTDATRERVKIRATQHKISAGLADLDTVQQKPDMGGFGVAPAHGQTMGHGLQTNAMTGQTIFNTLLHFLIRMVVVMSHDENPFLACAQGVSKDRVTRYRVP